MNATNSSNDLTATRESSSGDGCESKIFTVGVGASAGGLEALESLFENMPVNSGMAFVVIQHLSPDFKSHMDELLARRTSIPILLAKDQMKIEPNHIYLMPSKTEMVVSDGHLLLTEKDPDQQLSLPIDRFFRSIAQDSRECSIGIILSGTGSDGSRGIRDIHASGGLVISQSDESAKFNGMPLSAQETGVVDLILPPQTIPEALMKHVSSVGPASDCDSSPVTPSEPHDDLDRIIGLLRSGYGIDFTNYKPSTVTRRTERRLALGDSLSMSDYADRLEQNPEELNELYKDLLIGVTEFFRDADAFENLRTTVIPDILENIKEGEELRAWIAGCATGEEAYSIAMLILEAIEEYERSIEVKIFATDMHPSSLEFASAGVYSEDQLAGVKPEYVEKYFVNKDGLYQVSPALRRTIVFASHNVITDAPFTKLDLITCRNLLIYLQPMAQKKVFSLFHFSLKTKGFLFLGASETPGDLAEEFEAVNSAWKIYRKLRDIRLPADLRLRLTSTPQSITHSSTLESRRTSHSGPARPVNDTFQQLLQRFMPPGFLVDDEFRLLHTFGGAEKLLKVRGGSPPTTIVDMLGDRLKTPVSGALHHALRDKAPVKYTGLTVDTEEGTKECRLVVEPQTNSRTDEVQILILFEELDQRKPIAPTGKEFDVDEMSRDHIQSLESELRYTKENLQATIEELETSNEELQATNEELVASNEELQSTNEELHSVNEELYTVNGEHQRKISELTEITNDLDNLLDSSQIGVIFLDKDLCIRKYTTLISDIFQIERRDIGRKIDRFSHNILDQNLFEDALAVLHGHPEIEREVEDENGRSFLLRILPYNSDNNADGVILNLINIDKMKAAELALAKLSAIVQSSADAIIGKDLDGYITSWNRGAEVLYGYTAEEVIGKHISIIAPESRHAEIEGFMEAIRNDEAIPPVETERQRKDGTPLDLSLRISPIKSSDGKTVGVSAIARDITELKRIRRDLEKAVKRRDRFLAMLSHELRNPLGAVQNAAEVLTAKGVRSDQIETASNIIIRQSSYLTSLLNDLLDVTRITEGKIRLNKAQIDLASTVQNVLNVVQPQIEEREQTLEVHYPDEPLPVFADNVRLQQIQINLLTNASKYSPLYEVIKFSMFRDGDEAVIKVKDSGNGISKELQKRIFDPFVQSLDTIEKANGGMGIGLSLVKALTRSHDGSVSVFSDGEGRGSEFIVRIPISSNENVSENETTEYRLDGISRKRIVLVEDKPDNRAILSSILELEGHEVHIAENGQQGVDQILKQHPDIALIDIGLPDFDGCQVARRIRKDETYNATKLIALTGYGRPKDLERTKAAGFDLHIVKPLNRQKLVEALAQFTNSERY